MKITYCIPSKNNLRYLKSSIHSIKSNSSVEHDIIVYVDADNDGTEEWLIENKITYLKNTDTKPKGIAAAYNRCIEASKTHIVCMFHADMYMAKGFDTAILKHLKPLTVVSGTRIEPPLHPPGMEKIVKDFGMYPEEFKEATFNAHVEYLLSNLPKTTKGIFAPWAIYKEDITCIGMHDESFHSYHEDSDIFNRFVLNGYDLVQTWEAFVYHFTCRGGQFQDGVEQVTADTTFHQMKGNAARNYLRKWGSWIKNDEYQHPITSPKYNVAFVAKNADIQIVEMLEPWCDRLYIEDEMEVIKSHYIENEQPNTKYDLNKRILNINHNYPEGENDIVVVFDARRFNQGHYNIIQNLSDIITESGEVGTFELDCFEIIINNTNTYEKDLIKCNTTY
jgi:glycosyltransferase involved in cell wall biosynthesis